MFKSNGTGGLSQLYFWFVPYDKNKVRILNENINIVQNTETELYQDIEPTDKIIKVKIAQIGIHCPMEELRST